MFTVAPLSVSLLGKGEPLSAGRRYPLVCQCVGSRPPAAITWFLGSARMATAPGTVSYQLPVTSYQLPATTGHRARHRRSAGAPGRRPGPYRRARPRQRPVRLCGQCLSAQLAGRRSDRHRDLHRQMALYHPPRLFRHFNDHKVDLHLHQPVCL